MTEHPLTDDFCHRISETWPPDAAERNNMRSAADWQLEQVNDFFVNYRKAVMGANPGHIPSLTELLSLMNQAMRPTTTQENN